MPHESSSSPSPGPAVPPPAGATGPAAEAAARLDAIVGSAMDAIITVDREQRIVLFNAAAERMLECDATEAIGSRLERFIPERLRGAHHAHVENFVRTGATSRRMGQQTSLTALRADGSEFPIEASISQATVGGQLLLTVILRDISERMLAERRVRQAQEALTEGERRLAAIVRSAMDAIITVDAEQRVVLFNAAAEQMFGCDAAEAVGDSLDRFIPERFRAAHRVHIERFMRTGATSRRMGAHGAPAALSALSALWGLKTDGSEFPIEASISQATSGGHQLLTVILRDISGRIEAERQIHRAHDELRELSVAMLEVREAERTRIARELHDELGQALTALRMDVEFLRGSVPPERADLVECTAQMRGLLEATVATTRRISADLRPLVLDDLGLGAAAEWLVQSGVQRAGLACTLHVDDELARLGEPQASALFRIMQESLTNVARHARARKVDVRLERAGGEARLVVHDDGVGFDPDASAKPRSFGLRGMRERVLLLGGRIEIESGPGAGTSLTVRLPLAAPRAREAAA